MKNNDRLRKLRRNIDFHVASFQRKNDHFDLHFLHFGALEIWTGDYHVLRENYTPYQKLEFFARYLKIINTFFEKTMIYASYTVANCPRNSKMKWNFKQAKQFFKHMSEDAGWKACKSQKNADFRVHRDPLDHLSVNHLFKSNSFSVIVLFNWL